MRLFACLLLAAVFNSCAATRQPTAASLAATTSADATPQPSGAVVVFRKTPCMGLCPVYTATLFADGRVQYDGQRNMPLTGSHLLQLSPDTVAYIRREATVLGFASLPAVYNTQVTDLPATYFSVLQPDGSLKQVRVDDGAEAPAALTRLLAYVERQIERITVAKK